MNRQIIYIGIALVGILLVIISLGLYFIPTINLNTAKGTVEIEHPRNYLKSGVIAPRRYLEYTLIPTQMTKTNVTYRIVVDNGLVRQEDKISWSELELGILKPKLIIHSLTSDEYTAVSVLPKYKIMVYEIRPERDVNYLMIPFVYVGLLSLAILAGFGRKTRRIAEPYRKVVEKLDEKSVTKDPDGINKSQLELCMKCDHFKPINGVVQCHKDKCIYH